ncbi:putative proline-tRNA ligase [Tilletiaria anomala UBC 951]|uniref:proline--tRNA ligase n=1 Tax=Tilletiaria anomala (strain ATCC 24038 / CBS 436.72 / UBC 951) TaxID=1037660 RepID=A0A066VC15_TILAU|nr:putative proline-tRNA ligase [Tilletiaria anomala UBC 951]KDN36289.1 putative proline-tRNA ligase [Tilletiaria anomala UBC 951]
MFSLADVQARLASLSVSGNNIISHAATASPEEYKNAVSSSSAPASTAHLKTLVFKPKTAKTAKPVPVVIIARDETDTVTGALGKKLDIKEMRLAAPELLQEFFNATKDDVSPLSITSSNASQITLVIDSALASSSDSFALKAGSSDKTMLLKGTDIAKYLESSGAKAHLIDFAELKKDAPAPIAKANASSGKAASAPSATSGSISADGNARAKAADSAKIADAELIGITIRKDGDFSEWYQQVLRKGDMIDWYDVSGCYILKPWSYHVWQCIQTFFDGEIKKLGVENCYFPMFVSSDVLEREKDHIEGFAPEVAWVTRAGKSDLEKPIAIRPTSETVMYPYYSKWIHSHRDLPLKLNQWNSVVRWEFKHPQPFLRTREFLWQEGHTAFLTKEEATVEVHQILALYAKVYTDLLALPVVPGVKSEKEKFAGGLFTTTVEGFIPTTGRGIQGGTSHCLGQNFSKMFDISVEDPRADASKRGTREGRAYVWQNSWGLSTRTIGVMVMVHGDNKGLVMPPRVSSIQVVIVAVGINVKTTDAQRKEIYDACEKLEAELKRVGVRARYDDRDNYTPAYKFNDWELRGVPIRLEIGPQDLAKQSTLSARRDTGAKAAIPLATVTEAIPQLLETIHHDMYAKAEQVYRERRRVVTKWEDFTVNLNQKCHVIIPWCEVEECEDAIKERSARVADTDEPEDERAPSMGAKSLCIPLDQSPYPDIAGLKCPQCGSDAKRWTMFGRSY